MAHRRLGGNIRLDLRPARRERLNSQPSVIMMEAGGLQDARHEGLPEQDPRATREKGCQARRCRTGPVTCCSRVSAHGIKAKAAPRAPAPAPADHARLYRASTPRLRPVILARSIRRGVQIGASKPMATGVPLAARAPARSIASPSSGPAPWRPRSPPTRSGLGRLRRSKGYGESWVTFGSAASRSTRLAGTACTPSRSDGRRGGGLG